MKFSAVLQNIKSWSLIVLPQNVSATLPSRGACCVLARFKAGTVKVVLEPDGRGSHWFRIDNEFLDCSGLQIATNVDVDIETAPDWSEPEVPEDFMTELAKHPNAESLWKNISPSAHWDWIRWIRSTNNPETRRRRMRVAFDKLNKGEKRPCCFNRNLCTEPYISKSGVLLPFST